MVAGCWHPYRMFSSFFRRSALAVTQLAKERTSQKTGTQSIGLPLAEDLFWHEHYLSEPYFVAGRGYDQYQPAYALGWQAAQSQSAPVPLSPEACRQEFAAHESELCERWSREHASSFLTWPQARLAVKAAWERARLPRTMVPAVRLEPETVERIQRVISTGRRVQRSYEACLGEEPEGMLRSVLLRFAREHPVLLRELEQTFLPLSPRLARKNVRLRVGARYKQVEKMVSEWRDSGLMVQEPIEGLIDELQAWLDSYGRIDTGSLPLPAAQVIKRQMLVIRGHLDAVLLLGRDAA